MLVAAICCFCCFLCLLASGCLLFVGLWVSSLVVLHQNATISLNPNFFLQMPSLVNLHQDRTLEDWKPRDPSSVAEMKATFLAANTPQKFGNERTIQQLHKNGRWSGSVPSPNHTSLWIAPPFEETTTTEEASMTMDAPAIRAADGDNDTDDTDDDHTDTAEDHDKIWWKEASDDISFASQACQASPETPTALPETPTETENAETVVLPDIAGCLLSLLLK